MIVRNRLIPICILLTFLFTFSGQAQNESQALMGRWTGEDARGSEQTFVLGHDQKARWVQGSGDNVAFNLNYKINYEPDPHHISISGFETGSLKGKVLYGILEFSGSDTFRLDVEDRQPGSKVSPDAFTDQTVTYNRISPVQHIVLVWLKKPGDLETRRQLIETSKSFKKIPGVIGVSTGTPLQSERPVVDDSFDVAVIITFESREAMQNYQTHPRHTKAVEEVLRPVTDRMVIYDFEVR